MSALVEDLDVDDPPVERDAKAGFSSWCRRAQHESCIRAKARCSCSCHGARGQTPPGPKAASYPTPILHPTQRKEGTTMPDTTTKPIACKHDGCDRTFGTEHALTIHAARAHKDAKAQTPPQRPAKRAPKLDTAAVRATLEEPGDDYDPWVVLVGHVIDGVPTVSALVLSTSADAEQVTKVLTTLGHKAWRLRLADAQNGEG